jgi:hypothetical protein
MADGFSVDRGALREMAQGIDDTIAALKGLGFDEEADFGPTQFGSALAGLELSELQAGARGIQQALDDFCDRWSWTVRSLVRDGNQFASRLGRTAQVHDGTEDCLTGMIADAPESSTGDRHD